MNVQTVPPCQRDTCGRRSVRLGTRRKLPPLLPCLVTAPRPRLCTLLRLLRLLRRRLRCLKGRPGLKIFGACNAGESLVVDPTTMENHRFEWLNYQ